jgi:hypothetical protein
VALDDRVGFVGQTFARIDALAQLALAFLDFGILTIARGRTLGGVGNREILSLERTRPCIY